MLARRRFSWALLTLSLTPVACGNGGQATSKGSTGGASTSSATTTRGASTSSGGSPAGTGGASTSSTSTGPGGGGSGGGPPVGESVLQRNKHASRDGLYVEPAITQAKAALMARDPSLKATIHGNVYAQPLYVQHGPGGRGIFLVVTESNNVHAVAETDGSAVWTRAIGNAPMNSGAGCGNIHPLGITGTPAVDLASRTLYLDAAVADAQSTIQTHEIHALSIDDGTEKPGYPIDTSKLVSGATPFNPVLQNQRGALLVFEGVLYVPYGGHAGDCGPYHGWVVGVPLANPAGAKAWATSAKAGGIWAVGGPSSDGSSVFVATGNTYDIGQFPPNVWGQGDAVLRFKGLPAFSNQTADYFTPSNWRALDESDADLGGTGPLIVDVPGATPSALVVALGKNGVAYLLDRNNLGGQGTGNGGVGEGVASAPVANNNISNAPTTYATASGVYVVFNTSGTGVGCPVGHGGNLVALTIGAANPPTISVAWCADNQGRGSPIATSPGGTTGVVVWAVGSSDDRLHGFDGDTGAVVYGGGGAGDAIPGVQYFNSPIAVNGRIVVGANDALYAFKSP